MLLARVLDSFDGSRSSAVEAIQALFRGFIILMGEVVEVLPNGTVGRSSSVMSVECVLLAVVVSPAIVLLQSFAIEMMAVLSFESSDLLELVGPTIVP